MFVLLTPYLLVGKTNSSEVFSPPDTKEHVVQETEHEEQTFTIVHRDELERTGNWSLVRRSLGCGSFGVNLVDIPPGESIPEHDETGRDQEELFLVLNGDAVFVIDGADHPAPEGTFARLAPVHRRTVRNDGSAPASVLIVSAPTKSGYEPMEWA
jgi:uncharacterized cupin superfamily protein